MNKNEFLENLNEHNCNLLNDALFKFIFGKEEHKQITIDFLNAVLASSLEHTIQDLQFVNSELSRRHDDNKSNLLDVMCLLDSGEKVDIEVQISDRKNIDHRTLFYWAHMYLETLPAGGTYKSLKPCITINILNFEFIHQQQKLHSIYELYDKETGHRLTKDLAIHFLEIPKFKHKKEMPIRKMSKMERWLAFLANKLDEKEKEELYMKEKEIQNAMDAAKTFLSNKEERELYFRRELERMDRESIYEDGALDGALSESTRNIKNLMNTQNIPLETAFAWLNIPENKQRLIKKELKE